MWLYIVIYIMSLFFSFSACNTTKDSCNHAFQEVAKAVVYCVSFFSGEQSHQNIVTGPILKS